MMKRADFLKRLGIGLGAVVVAPKVLASINFPQEEQMVATRGLLWHLQQPNKKYYTSSYSLADFDDIKYFGEFANLNIPHEP